MFDEIAAIWKQQLLAGGARQRRIDDHPLALYFGADEASKPVFFLITDVEPTFPRLSDVVVVEKGRREDGQWTVVLTLQAKALTEAFMGMCTELVRRSASASSNTAARAMFFETLQHWKELLAGRVPRRMTDEQIRGLMAEIWFAIEVLGAIRPASEVLLAWHGPYGSPQDFQTSDGAMYEVKSVHMGSRSIEISSVQQLDPPVEGPLTLALVNVEAVPASVTKARTLLSLVNEFKLRLGDDPKAADELDHRLKALALDLGDDYYAEKSYAMSGPRIYVVEEDFPRILRVDVPLAVDKLNYRVRIDGLEKFERKAIQA